MSGPVRDWSARAAAIKHYEKVLKDAKRFNDDDKEMIEEVVNALRRSQDHTAIQTKLQATINENLRLRDKLLELAKQCSGCDGTGIQPVPPFLQGIELRQLPCPDCEDIRELLA